MPNWCVPLVGRQFLENYRHKHHQWSIWIDTQDGQGRWMICKDGHHWSACQYSISFRETWLTSTDNRMSKRWSWPGLFVLTMLWKLPRRHIMQRVGGHFFQEHQNGWRQVCLVDATRYFDSKQGTLWRIIFGGWRCWWRIKRLITKLVEWRQCWLGSGRNHRLVVICVGWRSGAPCVMIIVGQLYIATLPCLHLACFFPG